MGDIELLKLLAGQTAGMIFGLTMLWIMIRDRKDQTMRDQAQVVRDSAMAMLILQVQKESSDDQSKMVAGMHAIAMEVQALRYAGQGKASGGQAA